MKSTKKRQHNLVIDGNGQPWVAWKEGYEGPPRSFWTGRIASKVAGEWHRMPFGTMPIGYDVHDIRLAADPSGDVHAAYNHSCYLCTFWELLYAKWQGAIAHSSIVAGEPASHDIAIDPLGRVFVAFGKYSPFPFPPALFVRRSSGTQWFTDTLPIARMGLEYVNEPDIAISGDGLPALIAHGLKPGESAVTRYFFWWDGFGWRSEGTGLPYGGMLAFDGNTPVIAWSDQESGGLYLARRVPVEIEPQMWIPLALRQ